MVIFGPKMGKLPFWAKNGKMEQKDTKMAIFGKRKKLPFLGHFGQNWENDHIGPKR